jgi:hypothetical protein
MQNSKSSGKMARINYLLVKFCIMAIWIGTLAGKSKERLN